QPLARLVAAAGVADAGGVVAEDEDRLVAEFLEKAELAQRDGMAEVDFKAGRVDAVLDPQRLAGRDAPLQLFAQLVQRHDLLGAAPDQGELFLNGFHGFPSGESLREHLKAADRLESIDMVDDRRFAPAGGPAQGEHVEAGGGVEEAALLEEVQ